MIRRIPDENDDDKVNGDVYGSESEVAQESRNTRTLLENDASVITRGNQSRRQVLGTGAALVTAASAGCLGNVLGGNSDGSGGTDTPTATPTPSTPAIESFEIEGNNLVINIAEDANNIYAARLISPDGEDEIGPVFFESTTEVKIPLVEDGNPITGGIYTLELYNENGEVVSKTTVPLKAKPEVVDVKLVSGEYGPVPQVTVTNTGRLPTPVQYVGFPDNVPSPKPVEDENMEDPLLGGMDRVDGGQDPLISKGEKGTFKSTNEPFYFDANQRVPVPEEFTYNTSEGVEQVKSNFCNGESVDTVLLVIAGGKRLKFPTTVTYGGEVKIQDALGRTFTCTNISVDIQNANETASGNGTNETTTE